MGLEVAMARIGEIQSAFTQPSAATIATPATTSDTSTATRSTEADQFAALLDKATTAQSTSGPTQASAATAAPATSPGTPTAAAPKAETASQATDGSKGQEVVDTAKKYLGVPYVWGGTNPDVGLDCSGLVQQVFKELGYNLPRVARDQAKEGTEVASLSEAKPGDVLGMRNGKHIAIYLGDNKILHAPQPGEKVSIRSLQSWDDIDTIRRIIPEPKASTPTVDNDYARSLLQMAGAAG